MNFTDKEIIKKDFQSVQDKLITAMQAVSRVTMADPLSDKAVGQKMDEVAESVESACVCARNIMEKYRMMLPREEKMKASYMIVSDVSGRIEVTAEGWIHISLNSLLPHCKYKNNPYLSDTLRRLVDGFTRPLPKYKKAFLAIIESCDYKNRRVFDQDNKAWKMIPNALKGIVIEDDDQFHLDIGLFSKFSPELACDIYVIPEEQIGEFMYYLSNDLL